jgi:hypothetical protein
MAEKKVAHDVTQHDQETEQGSSRMLMTPAEEKKLVRKLDMFIIPVYMITYLVSFLDRANIGNAKIAGLTTDLHLKGSEFNGIG